MWGRRMRCFGLGLGRGYGLGLGYRRSFPYVGDPQVERALLEERRRILQEELRRIDALLQSLDSSSSGVNKQ